jgi:hypothetical protein
MGSLGLRLAAAILGLAVAQGARADAALFLEEPFGEFGAMTPTGHASVYLSRVCAATLVSLRRCQPGEQGVVISRYHRVGGYDWIAIPLIAYLYAVDRADQIPHEVTREQVALLRDDYRRRHLEQVAPDDADGAAPKGDWIQLVGAAYDRTIYAFEIETTEDRDEQLIAELNARPNEKRFNILFHNCADFSRHVIDFYFPKAVHRNFLADLGIMTPKQAAKNMVSYAKRHPDLHFSAFAIPQIPGTEPRSKPVRGVLESFVKTKKYAFPLGALVAVQPYLGGGLAYAWISGGHFNPRHIASTREAAEPPAILAKELEWNRTVSSSNAHNASAVRLPAAFNAHNASAVRLRVAPPERHALR